MGESVNNVEFFNIKKSCTNGIYFVFMLILCIRSNLVVRKSNETVFFTILYSRESLSNDFINLDLLPIYLLKIFNKSVFVILKLISGISKSVPLII